MNEKNQTGINGLTKAQGIKKHGRTILLFALASFYFLTVDVVLNDRTVELLGPEKVIPLYAAAMLLLGVGFAVFSYLHRATDTPSKRKAMLSAVFAASALALFGFVLVRGTALFVTLTLINMITAGVIGGAAHYYAAVSLRDRIYSGRVIGLAIGFEALLQVMVVMLLPSPLLKALALVATLGGVFYLVVWNTPAALDVSGSAPDTLTDSPSRASLLYLAAIVAVMSLMGGLDDGIVTSLNTQHVIDFYSYPRLLYLVGVVGAGFIADIQRRRFLPVTVLFVMICSTVGVMFLNNPVTYKINACIFSFFAGIAIMYFTVTFFDIAPHTENPMLWASMGRIIRFVFIAAGAVSSSFVFDVLEFYQIIAVYIILSAILLLLFYFSGGIVKKEIITDSSPLPEEGLIERTMRYSLRYSFTGRELEVLECLLDNLQNKEIADKLFISERTVKFHITNIFKKTGTSKRTELLLTLSRNGEGSPE